MRALPAIPCALETYGNLDRVTLSAERGPDAEPSGWYLIEGEWRGAARQARVSVEQLLAVSDAHLRDGHGIGPEDAMDCQVYRHGLLWAAMALLIG